MNEDMSKRKAMEEYPGGSRDKKKQRSNTRGPSTGVGTPTTSNKSIEKLLSFWTAGGNVHPLLTQECTDGAKLKEAQELSAVAKKQAIDLEQKLMESEGNVANLKIILKHEGAEKQRLMKKMNSTFELINTITQHVTYASDTLTESQKHEKYLTTTYNNVILELRGKNEGLNQRLDRIASERNEKAEKISQQLTEKEAELIDARLKCEILEGQVTREKELARCTIEDLENSKKKLMGLEIMEEKSRQKIQELEKRITSECEKVQSSCLVNQEQLRQNYELELAKLRNELEETRNELKAQQEEKEEVFRTLAGKEKEIESLEKKVEVYAKQSDELQGLLNVSSCNLQQFNNEKSHWENELQAKNDEIFQTLQRLNLVTKEKLELEEKVVKINKKLNNEENEKIHFKNDLSMHQIRLQENIEQDQIYKQKMEQMMAEKDSQIKELDRKIERLESEHKNEMLNQTEKYKSCLSDLNKISSKLSATENLDTVSRAENEKYRNQYFQEQKEKEKIQKKLENVESLMVKKVDDESQLMEQFKKLQANYKAKEKALEKKNAIAINELERKLSFLQHALEEVPQPIKSPSAAVEVSRVMPSISIVPSQGTPKSTPKRTSNRRKREPSSLQHTPTKVSKTESGLQKQQIFQKIKIRSVENLPPTMNRPILKSGRSYLNATDSPASSKKKITFGRISYLNNNNNMEYDKPDVLANNEMFDKFLDTINTSPQIQQSANSPNGLTVPTSVSQQITTTPKQSSQTKQAKFFKSQNSQSK